MTVVHDAYLFDPQHFRSALESTLREGTWSIDLDRLQTKALQAFDTQPFVALLADRYGGWDRPSIEELSMEDEAIENGAADVWLSLILYAELEPFRPDEPAGLAAEWRVTQQSLIDSGWSTRDAEFAVHGHRLSSIFALAPSRPAIVPLPSNDLRLRLHQFSPPSTASCAGWLSFHDVLALRHRLAQVTPIHPPITRYVTLLDAAIDRQSAVCIIQSG